MEFEEDVIPSRGGTEIFLSGVSFFFCAFGALDARHELQPKMIPVVDPVWVFPMVEATAPAVLVMTPPMDLASNWYPRTVRDGEDE